MKVASQPIRAHVERARRFAPVLGCAVLAILMTGLPVSGAKFTATTGNTANGWGVATMNPPGSFTAARPCTPGAATAPTFQAVSTTTATGTGLTISPPAGGVAGDYYVAAIALEGNTAPALGATPAGWSLLLNTTNNGNPRLAVYGLYQSTSTPPGAASFAWAASDGAAAFIARYSGVSSAAPTVGGTNGSGTNKNTATITYETQAPTGATPARLLAIGDAFQGNTLTASTPTNMTAHQTWTTTGGALVTSPTTGQKYGLGLWDESVTASVARSSALSGSTYWLDGTVLLYPSAGYDPTINLSWTVTPDTYATGYEIIRSGGPTTAVSGRNTLAWSDTTTSASTAYTYTISATYLGWHSTTRTVNVAIC